MKVLNAFQAVAVSATLLVGTQAASGALYSQNFDGLSATATGTVAGVNGQVDTVDWQLHSTIPWNSGKNMDVVDEGSGDMAVRLSPRNTSSYQGTPVRDLLLYRPTEWPDFQDVTVSGQVTWNTTISVNRPSYYGGGLVVRADSSSGNSGGGAFTGTFYLVRLLDADSSYYGAGGDTMELIQVVGGVETVLAATSVDWQNGFADFNTASSREDAYLQVAVQNTPGGDVSVSAIYSTDKTFSDASQEIITGTWLDSSAGRILDGGSVGFGHASNGSFYLSGSLYWDDLEVATVGVPEPATVALLGLGGLAMTAGGVRCRQRAS